MTLDQAQLEATRPPLPALGATKHLGEFDPAATIAFVASFLHPAAYEIG